MKVVLIGATGFVGSVVLNEMTERGYQVTAIARNLEILKNQKNVVAKNVNILNTDELAAVLKDHEVVVSAYNAGWNNPNQYNEFLQGSLSIQNAAKKSGTKRIIVVGGAGSLFISDGLQKVDSPNFPEEWKSGALAARDYLNILKNEKDLDWTFLSPALEMHQGTSGTRIGTYRTGLEKPVYNEEGRSIISVEDIAVAIVDELEKPKHNKLRFTVGY